MKADFLKLCSCILMAVFFGCSDNNSTEPDTTKSEGIIPLKVGNQWIFKRYHIDSTGTQIAEYRDTMQITGTKMFDNEMWYKTYISAGSGYITAEVFQLNRANGLWNRDYIGEPNLAVKFPAQAGDTFYSGEPDDLQDTMFHRKMHVLSTDTTITTPAGMFKCYAYGYYYNSSKILAQLIFYAPSVGYIKEELYAGTGLDRYGVELINYTLK
ncbi:MAG TPA: hypothetical protein VEC36_02675 [Patescibacteria group bacterium]|nr:hypothetical protein [Patescibacteria group bacterium]